MNFVLRIRREVRLFWPNSVRNKNEFSIDREKRSRLSFSFFRRTAKFLGRQRALIAPRNQFISAITAERESVYLRDASSFVKLIALRWLAVSAGENCGKKGRKKAYRRAGGTQEGRKEGANRIVIKRSGRGGASCWSARDNGRLTEYDLCPNITGQR